MELLNDAWSGEEGYRFSELVGVLRGHSHNDCEQFLIFTQS
jgi:hypothetical protein